MNDEDQDAIEAAQALCACSRNYHPFFPVCSTYFAIAFDLMLITFSFSVFVSFSFPNSYSRYDSV